MDQTDAQLLAAYVKGSQEASATLVGRHMGMVLGVARRQTRDGHAAEDVAQAVFVLLARQAGTLGDQVSLPGWLHNAAVFAAREEKRADRRRRWRERQAAAQATTAPAAAVDIDETLAALPTGDRDVLVLRYLQERSVDEVAVELGIQREAARKRLTRALGRLRRRLQGAEGALGVGVGVGAAELVTRTVGTALGMARLPAQVAGLVERTWRMLAIKRWMWTAKAAAAVLIAGAALVPVVQMALAETTAAATRPTVATTSGPATTRAKEVTMDLLTPEAMKLWWVEPKHDHYQLKDGELVVHYKEAQGAALRGEIGGMSLDNYQVSLEFFIEDEGTYGVKGRGGFQWNVQIAPRGTLVFCQAFPNTCNICCWDPRQKDPFRHLSDRKNEHYKPGQWNTMELFAEEGRCTLMMNGKLAAEADVPISTKGMLGLVVNFASDATVRIRNMKLTLLEPTPEQVKELATPALKNWENWVAVEKAAGRPGKLSPVDDATTTNRPLERPTSGTEERPGETQPGK